MVKPYYLLAAIIIDIILLHVGSPKILMLIQKDGSTE